MRSLDLLVSAPWPLPFMAAACAGLVIALSGCGISQQFTTVTVSLSPEPVVLPLEHQTEDHVFAVGLVDGPSDLSSARFTIDACIETGPAGTGCVRTRVEEPSPFEQPEGWMSVVREDNAALPYASVDGERFALYVGDGQASFGKSLLSDDEPVGEREYSVRFDRADSLQQAAGIAPPVVHINWNVTATATFPDNREEEGAPDPSVLRGDFIRLEFIEREPLLDAWELDLPGDDAEPVDDD
jgi:hypothetical protein